MSQQGIRICEAPGSFAMHKDKNYIQYLCTTPTGKAGRLPQVIGGTEAKDWDVKDTLWKLGLHHEWSGIQYTENDAKRGCFFVVHKSVTINSIHLTLGAAPYIGRRRVKMLSRYQLAIHCGYQGQPYFLDQVHDPPQRYSALQPRYDRHTTGVITGHPHAAVLGDFNQSHRALAAKLHLGVAVGDGIIGILNRPGLHTSDNHIDNHGVRERWTDHPALHTTLLPRTVWNQVHK